MDSTNVDHATEFPSILESKAPLPSLPSARLWQVFEDLQEDLSDLQETLAKNYETSISNNPSLGNLTLYQKDVIKTLRVTMQGYRSDLGNLETSLEEISRRCMFVRAFTGAGKSQMMKALLCSTDVHQIIGNKYMFVVASRKDVADQLYTDLSNKRHASYTRMGLERRKAEQIASMVERVSSEDIKKYHTNPSHPKSPYKKVIWVTCTQSLYNNLHLIPPQCIGLILIDEIDNTSLGTNYARLIRYSNFAFMVGFSATDTLQSGKNVCSFLGLSNPTCEVPYAKTYSQGMSKKFKRVTLSGTFQKQTPSGGQIIKGMGDLPTKMKNQLRCQELGREYVKKGLEMFAEKAQEDLKTYGVCTAMVITLANAKNPTSKKLAKNKHTNPTEMVWDAKDLDHFTTNVDVFGKPTTWRIIEDLCEEYNTRRGFQLNSIYITEKLTGEYVKEQVQKGIINIIVFKQRWERGIDLPMISTVMCLRSMDYAAYIQTAGRMVRRFGNVEGLLIDFGFNTRHLSYMKKFSKAECFEIEDVTVDVSPSSPTNNQTVQMTDTLNPHVFEVIPPPPINFSHQEDSPFLPMNEDDTKSTSESSDGMEGEQLSPQEFVDRRLEPYTPFTVFHDKNPSNIALVDRIELFPEDATHVHLVYRFPHSRKSAKETPSRLGAILAEKSITTGGLSCLKYLTISGGDTLLENIMPYKLRVYLQNHPTIDEYEYPLSSHLRPKRVAFQPSGTELQEAEQYILNLLKEEPYRSLEMKIVTDATWKRATTISSLCGKKASEEHVSVLESLAQETPSRPRLFDKVGNSPGIFRLRFMSLFQKYIPVPVSNPLSLFQGRKKLVKRSFEDYLSDVGLILSETPLVGMGLEYELEADVKSLTKRRKILNLVRKTYNIPSTSSVTMDLDMDMDEDSCSEVRMTSSDLLSILRKTQTTSSVYILSKFAYDNKDKDITQDDLIRVARDSILKNYTYWGKKGQYMIFQKQSSKFYRVNSEIVSVLDQVFA